MQTPMTFDDDPPEDHPRRPEGRERGPGIGAAQPFLVLAAAGAILGVLFAGVSTSDFITHLDRQVHSIHCSFIPGAGAEIGESGCRTVMLSPYSSVFRERLWGGLPISLLALAVFAYLTMHLVRRLLSSKPFIWDESFYLLAAAALPLGMSILYGYISVTRVGAVCKLCIGIYASSAVVFLGAGLAHLRAAPVAHDAPSPLRHYGRWFAEGVLYAAALSAAYVMFAPTSPKSLQGCGTLVKKGDEGILIPLAEGRGGTPAIAVVDPLCPACKGFDERMRAGRLYDDLKLDAVLFPLDSACNWMVKESLHPGACAVSEAMLCDRQGADAILGWAFAHQEELRTLASSDSAIRQRIEKDFPKVKGCLGSARIRNQLNRSLRWAVANALPVLTPQLFIGDRRVCDEDTDLGLEYTVASMTSGAKPSRERP